MDIWVVLWLFCLLRFASCVLVSDKLKNQKFGVVDFRNLVTTLVFPPNTSEDLCVSVDKNQIHCGLDQFKRIVVDGKLSGLTTLDLLSDNSFQTLDAYIYDYDSQFLSGGVHINYPDYGSIQADKLNVSVMVHADQYPLCYFEVLGIFNNSFPSQPLSEGPITASNIEPASWFYRIIPTISTVNEYGDTQYLLGLPTPGYIEFVLSDEAILKHRKYSSLPEQYALNQLSAKIFTNSEPVTKRINVCLWTSVTMDGQKSIWLQQTEFLDQSKFHFSWIISLGNGQTLDENKYPDLLNSNSVYLHLKKFGNRIEIFDSPFNSFAVNRDDLDQKPSDGSASASEVWNENLDELYRYIHNRFVAANFVIKNISPRWCITFYEKLISVLKNAQCDVLVFGNSRGFSSDVFITDAARLLGIPTATELLNLYLDIDAMPDAVVGPSTYAIEHESISSLGKYIEDHKRLSPVYNHIKVPKLVVIPPSVDSKKFHPSVQASQQFYHGCENMVKFSSSKQLLHAPCISIGFVARLSPGMIIIHSYLSLFTICSEKNPGLFVQAAYEILQLYPFARFTFVGDGILSSSLRQLVERLEMTNAFTFLGWVNDDLPQVIKTFDIVVNPSLRAWSETFCIANIEIMSMEVPLVTFGVGGIGEYVKKPSTNEVNNELFSLTSNAVLVNKATPQAVAQAVLYLINNTEVRLRIGREGRQSIQHYFTIERQMNQYSQFYSELYRNHKRK